MSRLFWLGVGLAAGALVVRKLTKKAEAFTPAGISESLQTSAAGLLDTVREFVEEVREGMAERESELYGALAGDESVWSRATAEGQPRTGDRDVQGDRF
jgi:hypothetical protein